MRKAGCAIGALIARSDGNGENIVIRAVTDIVFETEGSRYASSQSLIRNFNLGAYNLSPSYGIDGRIANTQSDTRISFRSSVIGGIDAEVWYASPNSVFSMGYEDINKQYCKDWVEKVLAGEMEWKTAMLPLYNWVVVEPSSVVDNDTLRIPEDFYTVKETDLPLCLRNAVRKQNKKVSEETDTEEDDE
jgi:hypothetical protein